jgi:hypothetical protein
MDKTSVLPMLCGTALLLTSCGGTAFTPAQETQPVAAGFTAVAQQEDSPPLLFTSAGNVCVSGAEAGVGFPPGCEGNACEITVTPGVLVVVWLEGENGGQIDGDLSEECEEDARLIGEDGQPSSCFSAGVLDGRSYLLFPVPVPSSRYALRWGDNPPIEIVP